MLQRLTKPKWFYHMRYSALFSGMGNERMKRLKNCNLLLIYDPKSYSVAELKHTNSYVLSFLTTINWLNQKQKNITK